MSKYFFIVAFTFTLSALSGQITVNPNPLTMTTTTVDSTLKYDFYFTNTLDTTYNIYWMLAPDANWPPQWGFQLCDLVLCYAEGGMKSSNNLANKFPKGTHHFYINLNTRGVAGSSSITIKLFTEKNCQGQIFSAPISAVNAAPNNSVDIDISNIELFPNPASNYFQIGNGGLVDRVDIFNLLGKNVKTVFRNDAAQYEIGDLNAGVYLVKMYDTNRKMIKTVKLYRE